MTINLQPRNFKVILWDMDGTLLNFHPAEKYAIETTMAMFKLPLCTEELRARYAEINADHWLRMEKGEINKQQVLEGRFQQFFREFHIGFTDYALFNKEYQKNLGAKVFFYEDAYEIVANLKGKIKQYAITNGNNVAQQLKLKNSGLGLLFDGVFISDQIGYEKPSEQFFAYALTHLEYDVLLRDNTSLALLAALGIGQNSHEKIARSLLENSLGTITQEEILVIGDSLTSDMLGGYQAGLKCCWFNVENGQEPEIPHIDYNISRLREIEKFI